MNTDWSNTTRALIIIIVLIMAVWLAVAARPLLQALGIAALLAYLLEPAVRFAMRITRLSRSWATRIVFILFMLFLVGISAWLGTIVADQLPHLQDDFLAIAQEGQQWLAQPVVLLNFRIYPQELLGNLPAVSGDYLSTVTSESLNILSGISTNLLWASVILISLYYFLKDSPKIKPWLTHFVFVDYQPEIRHLLDDVDQIWGKFLRAQILIFVILGFLAALGTLLVLWLFRAGHLEWSFWGLILLLLLVYTAVQQVDNFLLRPQLLGKQLSLHPGVIFVALIGALALNGILGALVIVPIIATVRVVGRYIYLKLLDLPPWPEAGPAEDEQMSFDKEASP